MRIPTPTALILAIAPLLCACASGREAVAAAHPELLPVYDEKSADEQALQREVQSAEDSLRAALDSEDPADDHPAAELLAEANQRLDAVEKELASIEEGSIRDAASPFAGLLPYGLGALALEATVALGSRRKRKLYGSAFRALTKGQLLTSAGEILKAYGAAHSSPQPQPPQPTVLVWNASSAPLPPQE